MGLVKCLTNFGGVQSMTSLSLRAQVLLTDKCRTRWRLLFGGGTTASRPAHEHKSRAPYKRSPDSGAERVKDQQAAWSTSGRVQIPH